MHVPWVGLSLINAAPTEVLFLSVLGVHATVEQSPDSNSFEFRVDHLQLDNLLASAGFPIVLGPTPVPPDKVQPVLQFSANVAKDAEASSGGGGPVAPLVHVRYLTVLLQELDVWIEQPLVGELMALGADLMGQNSTAASATTPTTPVKDTQVVVRDRQELMRVAPSSPGRFFVDLLQLQPVAVNLTFTSRTAVVEKRRSKTRRRE
eukprot:GABV01000927.1.p1 GENE.GABV01000927.1~~GABV01000927.1.p1  ORF type:complete len:206 (-),score=79.64 GABV01000927.1:102-719(-)